MSEKVEAYKKTIIDILGTAGRVECVIIIIPGKKQASPIYHELKQVLVSQVPIPSQMILAETIAAGRNLRSAINKLFIQCNAKIGGTPWGFVDLPMMKEKKTMICGIVIYRKCREKGCSYSALVCTMDRFAGRYYSQCSYNKPDEKVGDNVAKLVLKACKKFKEVNGDLPERIIVMRDGVSESQYEAVYSLDAAPIKEVLKDNEMTKTSFIFMTINQVNHGRFFRSDKARLYNPDRGTLIDTGCVKEDQYDFFLVPHGSRQGIQGPTRFNILYSDEKIDVKGLYLTCFRLCYGYYNYQSSIKVPSPVLYAHKLAYFLGGIENKHGKTLAEEKLYTKLFYI